MNACETPARRRIPADARILILADIHGNWQARRAGFPDVLLRRPLPPAVREALLAQMPAALAETLADVLFRGRSAPSPTLQQDPDEIRIQP